MNHAWGNIAAKTSTQNAGRRLIQVSYRPEFWARHINFWQAKIGMVEKIEELKTNSQHGVFPARDFRVFHNGEVGIEVLWSTKAIPSLGKCNPVGRAIPRCTQSDQIGSMMPL